MFNTLIAKLRRIPRHASYIPMPTAAVWRLEHCPGCGYDLRGSPDAGVCPECGGAYDCSRVVLHGYALGRFAELRNMTPMQAWVQIVASILPFVPFAFFAASAGVAAIGSLRPWLFIGGIAWAGHVLIQLLTRLTNGRPWLIRIDCTGSGVCQINDFDPRDGAYKLLTFLQAIYIPAILLAVFGWMCRIHPSHASSWLGLVLMLGVLAVLAILWRGRRIIAIQVMKNPKLQRALWSSWDEVVAVHLEPRSKPDEYGIAIRKLNRASGALSQIDQIAHALVSLSPGQVDALVHLIAKWNPRIRITTTPSHPSGEAKSRPA